ncbi:type II secretion system protein GspC [Colwellia sp. KU-HH00111]|uniref:type II secretion system protein GspC n=1 Tax=Colwellia sp. KU-HH00111 TaxID=3127652 RepID=UPI00310B30E6
MAFTDNLTSISAVLIKLPQQRIAQAFSLLLLIYIAFMAAKITWLVVPQAPLATNNPITRQVVSNANGTQSFNITELQSLNLFGQYNKPVVEENVVMQVTDAPQTRLQLTLSGIVASDQEETAAAIIENKGKQATYGVGDLIQGTRASLERVLVDRVFIKHSGRLETLMLDGADFNQPAQSVAHIKANTSASNSASNTQSKQNVVDQRSNKELSKNAQRLRTDLKNNPGKITDYLRISPANKNGAIVGYRLSPGKSPEFFKLSGLKSGDIAVQMNGYDLLLPLELAQAMSALKTDTDISLLVNRQGDLIEILFSIN